MSQRRSYKNAAQKRDGGQFIQIPMVVLNSDAYLSLSTAAVKLLWDIAAQFKGDNNGRLSCAWKLMKNRGWNSQTTLAKAKAELLQAQLICETRKGARPNKASWYAVTWQALDEINGMDIKPSAFPRGAYRHLEIAPLAPFSGVMKAP